MCLYYIAWYYTWYYNCTITTKTLVAREFEFLACAFACAEKVCLGMFVVEYINANEPNYYEDCSRTLCDIFYKDTIIPRFVSRTFIILSAAIIAIFGKLIIVPTTSITDVLFWWYCEIEWIVPTMYGIFECLVNNTLCRPLQVFNISKDNIVYVSSLKSEKQVYYLKRFLSFCMRGGTI